MIFYLIYLNDFPLSLFLILYIVKYILYTLHRKIFSLCKTFSITIQIIFILCFFGLLLNNLEKKTNKQNIYIYIYIYIYIINKKNMTQK